MSFGLSHGKSFDVGEIGIDMQALPPSIDGRIDPRNWFENPSKPFEIEIGSGNRYIQKPKQLIGLHQE